MTFLSFYQIQDHVHVYQVPNKDHGVSVLIVLESLLTILYRDIESRLSSPYPTDADDIKTKMKRGSVETRARMRTQDPRLAPSPSLRPRTDGRSGFSPPGMLSSQDPCSQKRGRVMAPSGGRLGAEAPSSQSRWFRRKPLCPYNNDVLDAVQLQVSQEDAQSLLTGA